MSDKRKWTKRRPTTLWRLATKIETTLKKLEGLKRDYDILYLRRLKVIDKERWRRDEKVYRKALKQDS